MDAKVINAKFPGVASPRAVERLVGGQGVMDGAGVRINRVLTQSLQRRLDPFLMLDIFGSNDPGDYIAGFPDHPHRGFETVTYMIAGRMRHRDNAGHEGLLENGGMQWMTAGRGVIHSEMPEQEEGLMEGFQLWLNLPAKDKMADPWYRDYQAGDLPRYETGDGVAVIVIAGESRGVAGAVCRPVTEPLYLDIHLPAGAEFAEVLPAGHNAFVVPYRGTVTVAATQVPQGRMALLGNAGDGVVLRAEGGPAKAVLIAGRPLNEPIVQHGPFVMNSQEEILQAFRDYRDGRFA